LKVVGIVIIYFTGLFEVYYQANTYFTESASALALPVVWHLSFCAVLFIILYKNKSVIGLRGASILAVANIVLYAFWFSNYAFSEHLEYIATGGSSRIAYYLHYISFAIITWFGYQLYHINKEKFAFPIFKNKISLWVAAFFVVFITSSELTLHGLVLSNSPVTATDVKTDIAYRDYIQIDQIEYLKFHIADRFVDTVRDQVFRTGFPILWGILAFIFLITGIKLQNKSMRIIALALLGITILKLFLFDIRNASETGKIIAFILLGVLILIISFVYQKIKVLVLDDKSNSKNVTE
jgi:hypothetical protein